MEVGEKDLLFILPSVTQLLFSPPLLIQSARGVIECLKIVTRTKSQRIAKFAFDYATKKGRGKVTAVHKANIM